MKMWLWHIARHYSSGTTEKTHEKPQQEKVPCSRLKFGYIPKFSYIASITTHLSYTTKPSPTHTHTHTKDIHSQGFRGLLLYEDFSVQINTAPLTGTVSPVLLSYS